VKPGNDQKKIQLVNPRHSRHPALSAEVAAEGVGKLKEIKVEGKRLPNDQFSPSSLIIHPRITARSRECNTVGSLFKTLSAKAQMELKLVGLTDSDEFDSFIIKRIKDKFVLSYIFTQPLTNLRLLYHIKKTLGYGRVKKYKCPQIARFFISDLKV